MKSRICTLLIAVGMLALMCATMAGAPVAGPGGVLDRAVVASVEREQRCRLSAGEVAVLGRDGDAPSQVARDKGFFGEPRAVGERFVIVDVGHGGPGVDFGDPAIAPVFRAGTAPDAPFLFPTAEVIVLFERGTTEREAAAMVGHCGLALLRPLEIQGAFLFGAASPARSLESASAAAEVRGVLRSVPNWIRQGTLRQEDPLYPCQWHLKNTGQFSGAVAGNDINVEPVWQTYRGSPGQVICIVDDGLEIAHKDLEANIVPGLSWDFIRKQPDPTEGSHGTEVGGVAAAPGDGDTGAMGVAPEAGLCGYRINGRGGAADDATVAEAESRAYDRISVYNNSWGPTDDGQRLEGPAPLTEAAMALGIAHGRGGRGTIYTWAGGNGLTFADNSNYDGYANWRYTIAVGASTSDGKQSYYSEGGANLCVNAPSDGGADPGVTTTDRTGPLGSNTGQHPRDFEDMDFTSTFGGTSSATPTVSGVCALLLQANPDLGWRDVKEILMATASKNDPGDPDWAENGAGYPVNHKYGFGRVDAAAAVIAASGWTNLSAEKSAGGSAWPSLAIPLGPEGVRSTISLAQDLRVESVEVHFTALTAEAHWGDLQVLLESPSGTWSVLAEKHDTSKSTSRYDSWRFCSERHLGELSAGDWTLVVKDLGNTGGATFAAWRLAVYGTEAGVAGARPAARAPGGAGGSRPAALVFRSSPATAGTSEPGSVAAVPAGAGLPILAVPAHELQYEDLAGNPVYRQSTFAGWTADPPGNVTFADASRAITTATPSGDATITALFRLPDKPIFPGSGLRVAAADLGLETFTRKPSAYGVSGGKHIAMTVYGEFPSSTLVAGWPAKPKIYDPADYNAPPEGLGALLDREPMPEVALESLVIKAEGGSATLDLAGSRTFHLTPPDIRISGELADGNQLDIQGFFVGTKPPKIFVEYARGRKYITRKCPIAGGLVFEDLAGKPSCTDPWTGRSFFNATCPKAPKGAVPTGYVIIKSAIGLAAYFVPVRRPACE